MPKATTTAKNKYAKKAYDDIRLQVKKGQKEIIKAYADSKRMSLQGFINEAIKKAMEE